MLVLLLRLMHRVLPSEGHLLPSDCNLKKVRPLGGKHLSQFFFKPFRSVTLFAGNLGRLGYLYEIRV